MLSPRTLKEIQTNKSFKKVQTIVTKPSMINNPKPLTAQHIKKDSGPIRNYSKNEFDYDNLNVAKWNFTILNNKFITH